MECIRLGLQDIDLCHDKILVRGGKDRTTILPNSIRTALKDQIEAVSKLHQGELEEGLEKVYLQGAIKPILDEKEDLEFNPLFSAPRRR